MHTRGMERVKEVLACLKLKKHDPRGGLLLDLGCGQGYLHEYILNNGIEAVGVEINRRNIRYAKKIVSKGDFIMADGCNLPFKKECFNTIIANDVLEHVPYKLAKPMVSEVKRTLKTDGMFYISVANKYQIHEPHTLIPFLTWFPRACWNPIHKIVKKRPMKTMYYPYTLCMLQRLCFETEISYTNLTWIYALKKISKIDYIGNRIVRKIAKVMNRIGLSRAAQILAEKVSIIIFICNKK